MEYMVTMTTPLLCGQALINLSHATTLQYEAMSDFPSCAHSKEPIKPLHMTYGYFEPIRGQAQVL